MYYYGYFDWTILREAVLPFLLFFTVIFAILQRSKILGTEKKNFNVIVALVVSLLIIIPHISGTFPYEQDPVRIINDAIPAVSIFIILILMFILLVGIWGVEVDWAGQPITGWIALVSFIVVVYVFGAAANLWQYAPWLWWISDPNTQSLILIILIFAILVWFITKEPRVSKEGGFFRNLGSFLKKVK